MDVPFLNLDDYSKELRNPANNLDVVAERPVSAEELIRIHLSGDWVKTNLPFSPIGHPMIETKVTGPSVSYSSGLNAKAPYVSTPLMVVMNEGALKICLDNIIKAI